MRGGAVRSEPSPLDRAHTLSEGVHLDDVRAGGEQLFRELRELRRRDQRLLKERTAAAREEKEHGVLRREVLRETQCLRGRRKRVLIGHGMPRLHAAYMRDLPHHMIVFRDHKPRVDALPEHIRRRARHLPRRLADRDEHNAPPQECVPRERLLHRRIRQDCRETLLDDSIGIAAQVHDDLSLPIFFLIIAQTKQASKVPR